jgi:hypothetical protein
LFFPICNGIFVDSGRSQSFQAVSSSDEWKKIDLGE